MMDIFIKLRVGFIFLFDLWLFFFSPLLKGKLIFSTEIKILNLGSPQILLIKHYSLLPGFSSIQTKTKPSPSTATFC